MFRTDGNSEWKQIKKRKEENELVYSVKKKTKIMAGCAVSM